MTYRKRIGPKGPLPDQVIYMVKALAAIDSTETRNGFVPAFHLAEQIGVPTSSLWDLLRKMARLGILESRNGPLGGYRRLRKASVEELCSIVSDRYNVFDPTAWGPELAGFHGKFKALIWGYLV